ncbi:hypothetical protein LINGRAHAP2_LOCUS13453 [Linum grandiflorum]
MMRITWPILAILYLMAYTFLIPHIGACPTGYTMTL